MNFKINAHEKKRNMEKSAILIGKEKFKLAKF